jgi:CIC family chloride channel protein
MGGFRQLLHDLLKSLRDKLGAIFDLESSGQLLIYSAVIGVIAGLVAAAFFFVLSEFQQFWLGEIAGYHPPPAGSERIAGEAVEVQFPTYWWRVLLVPTLGGLVCGILVYGFAPEAEGHGSDAMIKSFHRLKGIIRFRVPWIKAAASIVTIGTGGSAGREGPIAQISAGCGSLLATRLGLADWERRQLMLAGAAGGIGAIFQAPLGGALFTVEVLYASTAFEFAAFIPCVLSSVLAYSVFCVFYGRGFAFLTPPTSVEEAFTFHVHELPFYLVFAVVCAVAGFVYVFIFYGLRDKFFRRLPLPNMIKPALGGLLLGCTALIFPQVMAGGYGWIQQVIDGTFGVGGETLATAGGEGLVAIILILAGLALAKIVATSFTISSGGSGGVFAPSLFIGAMLGGAYGWTCRWAIGQVLGPEIAEQWVPQPGAYVLVGMGGFFAGVAKVPLTALLMVCEMSHSYDLLVPLMLVSIITVALLSSEWSLYEEQVTSLIDSPAHLGDFVVDVLARIHVRDVYRPGEVVEMIPQDMPLPRIIRRVASANASYFPVVDNDERLVGIFSLHDVRSVLQHGAGAETLVVAADIATSPVLTVTPDDDLHTALRRFTRKNIDEIPVVDPDEPTRILGMLRRKEVIGAYDEELAALRHDR